MSTTSLKKTITTAAMKTTTTSTAKKTKQFATSTATIGNISSKIIYHYYYLIMTFLCIEASRTPLPKSLSEKIDYQIYQTSLLTGIVEDNRATLKSLLSMMSHLLDNNDKTIINHPTDEGKQHIENMRHINQG
jgi:hypothetical protein